MDDYEWFLRLRTHASGNPPLHAIVRTTAPGYRTRPIENSSHSRLANAITLQLATPVARGWKPKYPGVHRVLPPPGASAPQWGSKRGNNPWEHAHFNPCSARYLGGGGWGGEVPGGVACFDHAHSAAT